VATLWRFDEGEDRWTEGANGTAKVLTHRSFADNLLFIFRDEEGKLMAYHPFTPDTQLVKVDDVTWEWRAEKNYADDDEGFAEQFRLSLQSSERASQFQHYITRSNRQNRGLTDAAFSGPSPAWTTVEHVPLVGNAVVRNPFLAALRQHPFGRVGGAPTLSWRRFRNHRRLVVPRLRGATRSRHTSRQRLQTACSFHSSRWHQALLHCRRKGWLWKMNSSLLHKKRSGATRTPHGKHSSTPSFTPPSTAPRRTSSAAQAMTGRASTKSIASPPSRRFVLGARVMSHRSR
jgi:hypothetical protein